MEILFIYFVDIMLGISKGLLDSSSMKVHVPEVYVTWD